MNIVYYTSGLTGTGRLVPGISIYNAFARKNINCNYTILSSAPKERTHIIDIFNINHIEIPVENPEMLSEENYQNSVLYRTLKQINPDILVSERMWFTLNDIIDNLDCKKIYITQQVIEQFYSIELTDKKIKFNPEQYHKIISIEPYSAPFKTIQINPIIIRNKNEILDKKIALNKLKLSGTKKICLIAINYKEEFFKKIKDKYSYIEYEYDVIYSSNLQGGGLFPAVDYFNAFDLIISPAGYNQFWEAVYFNKEAVFEPVPNIFENQNRRISECQEYYFDKNGADQFIEILMNL